LAEQEKFINPLTDFGFKKLFGTEPNKLLLIDFLNELLPNKHKIEDLNYAKNEHLGEQVIDRSAVFDIYCKGQNGESFIVEIQKAKQNYFKDRSVYYSSFPIQEQAKKGGWNFKLEAIYTVGILDFTFDEHKNDKDIVHIVELKDQNCEVFFDKLKYIYIELPKFKKEVNELESRFDKWLYAFKHLSTLDDKPDNFKEDIFTHLFEEAEIAKFGTSEQKAYHHSLKRYRDINNVIDTSIMENSKKIAKKLKEKNMTLVEISEITGLDEDEIKRL